MPAPIDTLVTVFGGSGFLGRHVVRALAKRDYRIRVAVRRPELTTHLQPLGRVGQIHAVQTNLRFPDSVRAAMRGSAVAINLVGILSETASQRFDGVQADGASTVAAAASEAGARMVQVSAIGADSNSDSRYARSKAAGDAAVLEALPASVVLRPSVVFGPEDDFTNRFAAMARMFPVMPLVGAETKMQPVYVGDVADAVARAVAGEALPGRVYELGGPEVLSLRQITETILGIIDRKRMLVTMPFSFAKAQATILQYAPGLLKLTPDQVILLRRDNVVSDEATKVGLTLQGLGITPDSMEAVAPSYLWRFRAAGQFQRKSA